MKKKQDIQNKIDLLEERLVLEVLTEEERLELKHWIYALEWILDN